MCEGICGRRSNPEAKTKRPYRTKKKRGWGVGVIATWRPRLNLPEGVAGGIWRIIEGKPKRKTKGKWGALYRERSKTEVVSKAIIPWRGWREGERVF